MKTLCYVVLLTVAISALTSCSAIKQLLFDDSAQAYHNPHVQCAECHGTREPKAGKDLFPKGVNPAVDCLNCHKYKENHHPVDFVPADASKFAFFPLYSGKVTCLTCHEIHGGYEHTGTPLLLRGGPYAERREICFKCHEKEEYAGINPHVMFGNDGATLEIKGEPVCLLCHAVKPNPFKDRTANVRFKADIAFLCWRCHPPMPGSFLDKHFLVTPSEKTLAYMQAAEVRLEIILPLAPWGRITCSTCHNPHQKGLLTFVEVAKGADAPKKLRTSDMCSACHKL
jgi:predicted CXXCH cytochrome family protein